MEKLVREKFSRGQSLDIYNLCTTSTTQIVWLTATPPSCLPRLPSSSSRSAATSRRRTKRGGGPSSDWVLHVRCRAEQDWRQGALHLPQPRVDLPHQETQPLYLSDEVASNNIGAEGCSYLSQADLRGLESLYLSTFVEM